MGATQASDAFVLTGLIRHSIAQLICNPRWNGETVNLRTLPVPEKSQAMLPAGIEHSSNRPAHARRCCPTFFCSCVEALGAKFLLTRIQQLTYLTKRQAQLFCQRRRKRAVRRRRTGLQRNRYGMLNPLKPSASACTDMRMSTGPGRRFCWGKSAVLVTTLLVA